MGAGFFNLVIGGLAIAGGLSGRFSLLGTDSPTLLLVAGGAVSAYGVFQIIRARRG